MYDEADHARRTGDFNSAIAIADRGISGVRGAAGVSLSRFQLLKAEVLLNLNRTREAQDLLHGIQAPGSPELRARLVMDQAEIRKQSGDPVEARRLLLDARVTASQAGAASILAWIELRLGVLLEDPEEQESTLHHALELAQRQRDEFLIAGAYGNLGYIRLARSRYDEAISWFESADRAAQEIPSRLIHEKNLTNLGWCYFRLGQNARALESLSKAVELATQSGLADDQQRALGTIGNIHCVEGRFDQAIATYEQAREIAARIGNNEYAANWQNNITRAEMDKGDWKAAGESNRLARAALATVKDGQWVDAYTRLNSGFISSASGQIEEAEAGFHEAMKLAADPYQPGVIWQAHSGLADLYRSHNRQKAAGKEYAAAMNLSDREWLALSRDESKMAFRSSLVSVYQDYADFLAGRHEAQRAVEVAESSRARLLEQKLDGEYASLPRFNAAESVRLARTSGAVLLSYWLAPGRSYVWAVSAAGISQFTLPGEAEINALIDQHQHAIQALEDPAAAGTKASQQLYETLVRPAQHLLTNASQVIIVPDGRLFDLNFETLVVDGPPPHYWIEDAVIAVAPSLGLLRQWSAAPKHASSLLAIGDPLSGTAEFPRLPHLGKELQDIAADFPQADRAVYTGSAAYPGRYREAGPAAFTAIHFAAHAAANETSPLNSAIVLSPRDGNYKLYARDVAGININSEIVTISACRSAGSRAYSGEGLVGLAWAFFHAGAHNVIAGIWNVDDSAAPLVMDTFYREWRRGAAPAIALRAAKLRLVHSGQAYRKPYYWGPFEIFTRHATRSAIDLAWRKSSK